MLKKELLLVTTALEETWGVDEDILFLGEWCRGYLRREKYEYRKHEVLSHHWGDREKLETDESNLRRLHDELLVAMRSILNEIHDVNFSKRYWQIILDPWLVSYVAVIFDRWESIRVVLDEYEVTKTFSLDVKINTKVPRDYATSVELYLSDLWNHHLFLDILNQNPATDYEVIPLDIDSLSNVGTLPTVTFEPQSLKWRAIHFLDKVLGKFTNDSGVFFAGQIFPFATQVRLQIGLGQVPHFNFALVKDGRPKYVVSNKPLRQKASLLLRDNFLTKDNFESFLISRLFDDAPSHLFEDFDALRRTALASASYPSSIVSSHYHWSSEPFKIWSAERTELGAKLLTVEHGGSLHPRFDSMEFECDISDKKLVWCQPYEDNHVRLPAAKIIGSRLLNLKKGPGRWCLIVGVDHGRYVTRASAEPVAEQSLTMYSNVLELISNISNADLKESIKIRPYPNVGWDLEARFEDVLGKSFIQNDRNLYKAFDSAKVIICTYPNTTLSEGLISGRPTLLLYEKSLWELHDHFKPLLEVLRRAKIVHDDPVSLSKHLDKIWSDPESWWSSNDVLRAREAFSDMAISVPKNAIQTWVEFFKVGKH